MEGSNGGLIGLLIVNVIGFLTIVVTTIATQMKASGERKQAAEALQLQLAAQREAAVLAAKIEADKTEAERKWQREEREALAARAAADNQVMSNNIARVAKRADMAFAITTGIGLPNEPDMPKPKLSKRLAALAAAQVADQPYPKLMDSQIGAPPDFAVTELFRPDADPDLHYDVHDLSVIDATAEPPEEQIDVGPLKIQPYPDDPKK